MFTIVIRLEEVPRSSEEVRSAASDPGAQAIDEMIILPCIRLPPRETSVEDCERDLWVHPFWLVKRTSDPNAANMKMESVEIQIVKTMATGAFDLGKRNLAGFRKVTVPVMTTKQNVKQGEALAIFVEEVKAKTSQSKVHRWDTAIKKQDTPIKKQKD